MDKEGLRNDRSDDANGVFIFIVFWFWVNTVNAIIETQRSPIEVGGRTETLIEASGWGWQQPSQLDDREEEK
jgi:hypothetical protein